MTILMTNADLIAFIAQCRLGAVGSIGAAAEGPQTAVVGVAVTHQLELVFDTLTSSRKYANLISQPACSFVFWNGERTLQYEGIAEELTPPSITRYQQTYFEAWPDCRVHLSWPGIVYFVVRPTWIRYSNFDQNPPLIREFRFSSPELVAW
jgi:hypothetical protein